MTKICIYNIRWIYEDSKTLNSFRLADGCASDEDTAPPAPAAHKCRKCFINYSGKPSSTCTTRVKERFYQLLGQALEHLHHTSAGKVLSITQASPPALKPPQLFPFVYKLRLEETPIFMRLIRHVVVIETHHVLIPMRSLS